MEMQTQRDEVRSISESERRRKELKKILEKSRKVGLKSTEYQIIKEIKTLIF